MGYYERIINRLDELISKADDVLSTKRNGGKFVGTTVDGELFQYWKTAALSFLERVFGKESTHYQSFEKNCVKSYHESSPYVVTICRGVLKGAKDDVESGYFVKVEDLVAADIFTDFLGMAEHLLENGYKDPAASLVGAVLEDGLRKISNKNEVKLKSKENIKSLNDKLADKGIYNRIVQREIHTWNELRDYADHGHFDEYNSEQVSSMLTGVRRFLGEYL